MLYISQVLSKESSSKEFTPLCLIECCRYFCSMCKPEAEVTIPKVGTFKIEDIENACKDWNEDDLAIIEE